MSQDKRTTKDESKVEYKKSDGTFRLGASSGATNATLPELRLVPTKLTTEKIQVRFTPKDLHSEPGESTSH